MDERLVLRPHIQTGISYVKHFKDVKPEFFKTLKEKNKTNTDKIKHIFGSTWTQPCMGICMELLPAFTHTQAYLALSQKKKKQPKTTEVRYLSSVLCPSLFFLFHWFSIIMRLHSCEQIHCPHANISSQSGDLTYSLEDVNFFCVHSWSYLNTNISSCLNFFFFKWS